jgi:primosomal protein N' (replication factor Y)
MWQALKWASDYYLHSFGEVLQASLPVKLRGSEANIIEQQKYWHLGALGQSQTAESLKQATKQKALFKALQNAPIEHKQVIQEYGRSALNGLQQKQLVEAQFHAPKVTSWHLETDNVTRPNANVEQSIAISAVNYTLNSFTPFLLQGVTGSGKTEVYLQIMEKVLSEAKQVLILLPEIGLTPQMLARFSKRFCLPIGVLHSQVADGERLKIWQKAKNGELAIVIGTRSAVFTQFKQLGLIVVDEEHDGSFKQQDGFRYHARDFAVIRAHIEQCPIVMGSATPSFESLNNVQLEKYRHLILPQRAGKALPVQHQLVDIRNQPIRYGLTDLTVEQIRQHLNLGHQVMLFVNRRGYAPALICHQCGHVEQCKRCSGNMTLHHHSQYLECHHCGARKPIPQLCEQCHSTELIPVGSGTEQIEQGCAELFPQVSTVRIDSDSIRGKGKLQATLNAIWENQYQLIIGTQILSKGHHFPNVTLVVIVDVDSALFSADYRAPEHLAQLITQVSGRAGREKQQGHMLLQTAQPDHPLLQELIHNGFEHFARSAIEERSASNLPPFSYQLLFRAESANGHDAFEFLQQVQQQLRPMQRWQLVGPLPALMEKRQGKYRFQLVVQSTHRTQLNQLEGLLSQIESMPLARKVRWSIDRDPQDFI